MKVVFESGSLRAAYGTPCVWEDSILEIALALMAQGYTEQSAYVHIYLYCNVFSSLLREYRNRPKLSLRHYFLPEALVRIWQMHRQHVNYAKDWSAYDTVHDGQFPGVWQRSQILQPSTSVVQQAYARTCRLYLQSTGAPQLPDIILPEQLENSSNGGFFALLSLDVSRA